MPAARDAKFPICYENITAAPFGGMNAMKTLLLLAVCLFGAAASATAQTSGASAFATRLDDPRAIALTGAVGDGKTDDSAAIQAAIDKAASDREEGIVFIPQGRYRLTRTIYVWPAVRVIGWGAKRPVFVLADNTPGFSNGVADMVIFAGFRPGANRARARSVPVSVCRFRHPEACRPIPISPTPIRAPSIRR